MKTILIWLVATYAIIPSVFAQQAMIGGEISNFSKDTISIALLHDQVTNNMQILRIPVVNGRFKTNIYVPQAVYFAVSDDKNYTHGVLQPGDDITIRYNFEDKPGTLQFSGKGAERSTFFQLFAVLKKTIREKMLASKQQPFPLDHYYRSVDSLVAITAQQLESIRHTMNNDSYMLLYAHLTGIRQSNKYSGIGRIFGISYEEVLATKKADLTDASVAAMKALLHFNDSLYTSFNYVNDVYIILLMHYEKIPRPAKYDSLFNVLPPRLRQPVLTMFVEDDVRELKGAKSLDTLVNKIYGTADDNIYKQFIQKKIAADRKFKKGMPAPDFSLENDKGELVNLAAYKGKVVHIDFWFEACMPCQQMFTRLKPLKAEYAANKNIVFLCVSIDEKGVWKKAKGKIAADHLYTNNKGRFHPVIGDYNVDGYPTTYIIGKDGRIFDNAPSGFPEQLKPSLEAALKEEEKSNE